MNMEDGQEVIAQLVKRCSGLNLFHLQASISPESCGKFPTEGWWPALTTHWGMTRSPKLLMVYQNKCPSTSCASRIPQMEPLLSSYGGE